MRNSKIILNAGTRSSELSLIQTGRLLNKLYGIIPEIEFNIVEFSSPGDRDKEADLRLSEDDFFTRDIDNSLSAGEIDIAIHSAKDFSCPAFDGIDWFWAPWCEDPRDVLVFRKNMSAECLPDYPVIGATSERRFEYSKRRFPAGVIKPIRGTIKERLRKLDSGEYDAFITAAAALHRLELKHRIFEYIELEDLPVPDGQGRICVAFRTRDRYLKEIRKLFVHPAVFAGAGIGKKGNVTFSVAEVLSGCGVCLYDDLLNPEILKLINPEAKSINVGKRCGNHSFRQDEISNLILYYVRTGKRVVRLKGGDPAIFGRLSEEITQLEELDIPSRILPGITSFQSVASSHRIFLTGRGVNCGFSVFSARQKDNRILDISGLSITDLPVVLYMGSRILDKITRELIEHGGLSPSLPAAVIFGSESRNEEVISGTLNDIAKKIKIVNSSEPGLVIIGRCITDINRNRYNVLSSCRILLTGTKHTVSEASKALKRYGGIPIEFPLIYQRACIPEGWLLNNLKSTDWAIFTSPNAVKIFLEQMITEGIDIRKIPKLAVCGKKTAQVFQRRGICPELIPKNSFGGKVLKDMVTANIPVNEKIIRFRSDLAGNSLSDYLERKGYSVTDMVLYRTEKTERAGLPAFDSVFFSSPSAVRTFIEYYGSVSLKGKQIIAIGNTTESALAGEGIDDVIVSREASSESAVDTIAAYNLTTQLRRIHNEYILT